MGRKSLWVLGSALVILALLIGALSCAAPAAKPTPAPTAAPSPAGTVSPAPAVPAKVTRWKGQLYFASTVAPYGPFGAGRAGAGAMDAEWSKWLEKASGGRLVIDWAEPGAIVPAAEGLNAVKTRVVDINVSSASSIAGTIPEAWVEQGLPFAWQTTAQEHDGLYNYGVNDALKKVYAQQNIYWLPNPSGTIMVIGTTFPAPNAESIKGKKIRASGLRGEYINLLGGSPVAANWGEMYMGLKLGTFDGWMAGAASLEDTKLKEVTTGMALNSNTDMASRNLLINMDAFKALPQDIQGLIERDLPYVLYTCAWSWEQQCAWCIGNAAKQYGLKLYTWPVEDVKKVTKMAADTIYPKVAARSPGTATLLEMVKKQMKDIGKIK